MIVNLFVTSCDDFRKVLTETSSLKSKLRGKLEFGEETPSAEVVRASWASPADTFQRPAADQNTPQGSDIWPGLGTPRGRPGGAGETPSSYGSNMEHHGGILIVGLSIF